MILARGLNISINILRITDVDTGSVVAVGNNYFCDWRTYAKATAALGACNGDQAAIDDLINMVEDPDLFDMTISEPPELNPPEGKRNCLEVTVKKTEIIIGQIQINDIRNNANLIHGDNSLRGWRSHSKINYSLGRVNGDADLVACRLNYLSDPDCIDMQVTEAGTPAAPHGLKARLCAGLDARDEGHNNRQELTSVMKGCAIWLLGFGLVRFRLANSATTPGWPRANRCRTAGPSMPRPMTISAR